MRFLGARRPSGEPRRLGRRWLPRLLALAVGLASLVVVLALVAIHSLDRPWMKRRLQALAKTSGGVDLDYGAANLALRSGLELDGLVVQSPPALRSVAPELLRVGHVSVQWHVGALLGASHSSSA